MRPAFALYAEYVHGATPSELARKYGLPQERVLMRLEAVRRCLASGSAILLPEERYVFG
jgi:hypothetical protein